MTDNNHSNTPKKSIISLIEDMLDFYEAADITVNSRKSQLFLQKLEYRILDCINDINNIFSLNIENMLNNKHTAILRNIIRNINSETEKTDTIHDIASKKEIDIFKDDLKNTIQRYKVEMNTGNNVSKINTLCRKIKYLADKIEKMENTPLCFIINQETMNIILNARTQLNINKTEH